MAYDVGIDVGSVSINCMVIDERQQVVLETPYIRHFGLFFEETLRLLQELMASWPQGPDGIRSLTFTGVNGQLLAEILAAPYEVETIAQILGATHLAPGVRSIISIGGQDASLFQLAYEGDQWRLEAFNMNGPCASGTGSFMDQQAERLALSMYGAEFHMDQEKLQQTLEDFIALGLQATYPAPVACRCTVFTKSDMIHLQNKGESLPNIIAGLHYGNAANYISTIVGQPAACGAHRLHRRHGFQPAAGQGLSALFSRPSGACSSYFPRRPRRRPAGAKARLAEPGGRFAPGPE